MNYSIGEVSRMFGLPQSTLRYYDKEGLLPHIQRQGAGIRRFDEQAVEALRVIECLKKSGMEIKDIQQFMIWCGEGASTYQQRLELFQRRRAEVEQELARLKKQYVQERAVAKKQRYITQIQMIFQDPVASLDPRMTVLETIAEGLTIRGEKDKKVIEEKVYKVLERVGLVREHAGRYPHEFSGGQKQRIGVARAVIMNPELIIADEPVSALDVSIQAQVINLLNDLRHELGLTILFIAHDLSVVKYFSDRIGVMYYGKLVELASSDELFAHPLHPYTQSLLSAIPLPDPMYEKKRQRIKYDPLAAHDYSTDKPSMREVAPGHFVQCNDAEFEAYQKQLNQA